MIPLRILHILAPAEHASWRSGPASMQAWLAGRGHAVATIAVGEGAAPAGAPVLAVRGNWWTWWRRGRDSAIGAAATWGADLVHAHGEAGLGVGIEIARRIAAPLVAEPGSLALASTARLLREPWVSAVILPSEEHRSRVLADGRLARDRVAVVPPGVDAVLPPPRPADGSLSVAARIPGQGSACIQLARAIASLRRDGLAVTAIAFGSASDWRRFRAAARDAGLGAEACTQVDAAAALPAADVLVEVDGGDIPLHHVVDALAAGRPVVANAAGALPEMVDDGRSGILVPERDEVALAGALRLIAAADRRSAMSVQALHAARRFGSGVVGEAMLAAYRSAVGGAAAGTTATWRRLTTSRLRTPGAVPLDAGGSVSSSESTP